MSIVSQNEHRSSYHQQSGQAYIAQKSSYLDLVKALIWRYPTLRYLNFFIKKPAIYPVRVSVLEFGSGQVTRVDFDGNEGYEKLQKYLASSSDDGPRKRLYLVEDLSPQFIELLGSYLHIDGTVFASQIRDSHYSGKPWNGHAPKLPSFQDPEKSFTLRYYESRYFDDPAMPEFSSSVATTGNIRRAVTFGKRANNIARNEDPEGHVGHIRRNTSFWASVDKDGNWNVGQDIIFLHPGIQPPEHLEPIRTYPYQRGYRDFTPWPSVSSFPLSDTQLEGPRRVSLIDDVCYYCQHAATPVQISTATQSNFQIATFQLHIIASIWTNTLEHINAILSDLETMLWSIEHMISPHLTDEKKDQYMRKFTTALNEVNTMRRRLGWYVEEMRLNLETLCIDPSLCSFPSKDDSKFPHAQNFLSLFNRLLTYQSWAEKLLGVITAHVNLMETEKSITDSKSLSRLTILGFVFVPVSFVCSFFSMGGDFAVGENKFWVFWVVVLPLTLVIVVAAFWKWWWRRLRKLVVERWYYPRS